MSAGGASSVVVPAEVAAMYADFKTRRAFRWMLLSLDLERFELRVDRTGAPGSGVDEFLKALPDGEARYAVYDQVIHNKYGGTNTRLFAFMWSPSTAGRSNMAYASCRKGLDKFFSGTQACQCTTRKAIEEVLAAAALPAGGGGGGGGGAGGAAGGKKKKADEDDAAFDPDA
jgi:hypothetical protein